MSLDLEAEELALLKSALLSYKDCEICARRYPRTHSEVVRSILPKVRHAALKKV